MYSRGVNRVFVAALCLAAAAYAGVPYGQEIPLGTATAKVSRYDYAGLGLPTAAGAEVVFAIDVWTADPTTRALAVTARMSDGQVHYGVVARNPGDSATLPGKLFRGAVLLLKVGQVHLVEMKVEQLGVHSEAAATFAAPE
jgi:hypothetical protein